MSSPYDGARLQSSVNSFLGVLSHCRSYCLRKVLFRYKAGLASRGRFDARVSRFRVSV